MRRVERGPTVPAALLAADRDGHTELDRARAFQREKAEAEAQAAAAGGGDAQAPSKKKKAKDGGKASAAFNFAVYKHDEVKRRLDELFHGKCAYCETFYSASAPVDVEHYRPKGAVSEDETHPGYWWLAMDWHNLLPSCIDCNRKRTQRMPGAFTSLAALYDHAQQRGLSTVSSGKKDSFPLVDGTRRLRGEADVDLTQEQPLLLNPTIDDPTRHLQFNVASPLGLVFPRQQDGQPSARGAMSIQVYGLNRLGLVQDRTRLLLRLEFLGDLVVELGAILDDLARPRFAQALGRTAVSQLLGRLRQMQDRTLTEMRAMTDAKAPYSEMARAWVDDFVARLG